MFGQAAGSVEQSPFHLLCFLLAHLLFHALLAGQVDNMFHQEAGLLAVILVELHMNSIEPVNILLLIQYTALSLYL